MKIAAGMVVAIDYKLTDDSGEVIDSSDGEPLEYLQGTGQIVPGLERELEFARLADVRLNDQHLST